MGRWKTVRHGIDEPLELYDLKSDVDESRNVAGANPEVLKKIEAFLAGCRTDATEYPVARRRP